MKKILQVLSNHQSYDQIRIIQPLFQIKDELKSKNIVVSTCGIQHLTKEICQQFDICCFHGQLSAAVFSVLRNCKFCLFVDDLMENMPSSNPAEQSSTELEGLIWCYKNAKSLVCTTDYLSNHLKNKYNVDSFVCPNLINITKKENNNQGVLYSFGNSHTSDLEMLNNLKTNRKVYFFGHTLPSNFCDYQRNKKGIIELFPNQENIYWIPLQLDYEKYNVWMNNIDFGVGLIPLEDNLFNKAKSILKVGEYLQRGAISVVSNAGALGGLPDEVVIKLDENDWGLSVERAFANHHNTYLSCYNFWMDNYSYTSQRKRWISAYAEM